MSGMITGGCLCGQVRFEIENHFERFYLCHCGQCRKTTGSAFASNLFGRAGKFRILKGEHHIRQFNHPTRDFRKCFCFICGSGLPHDSSTRGLKVVPAGSLDGEPMIEESAHIFGAEIPDPAFWHALWRPSSLVTRPHRPSPLWPQARKAG